MDPRSSGKGGGAGSNSKHAATDPKGEEATPSLEECFCLKDILSAEDCRPAHRRDNEDLDDDDVPGEHLRLLGKLTGNRDVLVRVAGFRSWLYLDLEPFRHKCDWIETVLPALVESFRSQLLKRGLARSDEKSTEQETLAKTKRRYEEETVYCRQRLRWLYDARCESSPEARKDAETEEGDDDPVDPAGLIRYRLVRRPQVHGWEPEDGCLEAGRPKVKRRLWARLSFRARSHMLEIEHLLSRPQTVREPWAKVWGEGLLDQNVKIACYEGRSVHQETSFLTWMTLRGAPARPWSWFHLKRFRRVSEEERESWCDEEWFGQLKDLTCVAAHEGVLPELRIGVFDTEWMSYDGKFPQVRNWGDFLTCVGMVWADVQSGKPFRIRYEADVFGDPADPRYALTGDSEAGIPPNLRALGLPEHREAQSRLEAVARSFKSRLAELKKRGFGESDREIVEARERLDEARVAAFVRRHSTELECGRAWFLRLRELRFDVLWHFNGDKFDWSWTIRRLVMLEALPEEDVDWLRCSRLRHHVCHLGESEFNTKGKGFNAYQRLRIPGCLNYDMLQWAKDNHPKLNSFTLDNVLTAMNLRLKNDLKADKIFEYTRQGGRRWWTMIVYCFKDCKRTGQICQKGNFLPRWLALASITASPWNLLSSGGQQIRVWNLLVRTAATNGMVTNNEVREKPLGTFKWVDEDRMKCKLVVSRRPRESIKLWFRNVNISWSGEWPGRKEISTKFRVFSDADKRVVSEALEAKGYYQLYSGATVIRPIPKLYVRPTVTLDFASLYPSIIVAFVLCYATIVNDDVLARHPLLKSWIVSHEVQPGHPHNYVRYEDNVAILPLLLRALLAARSAVRKELNVTTDPARQTNLDAQQNEYKVTCNSVYGFTGAALSGKFPETRIAETVTYCGRQGLELTKQVVEAMDLDYYLSPEFWRDFVSQEKWLSAVTWYPRAKPAVMDVTEFRRKFKRDLSAKEAKTFEKIRDALDSVPLDLWTLPASSSESPHQNAGLEYLCSQPDLFWLVEKYGPLCDDPRQLIERGEKTVVVYGDSVSSDTPILWKSALDDLVRYSTAESFPEEVSLLNPGLRWAPYHGDKEAMDLTDDVFVWSDEGWTRCRRAIRHRTDKELFRVTTRAGSVVVTRDHSLLSPNGRKLHVEDCSIGTDLLHASLPRLGSAVGGDPDFAFALGLFFAKGSCRFVASSVFSSSSAAPQKMRLPSWSLSNPNLRVLDRALAGLTKREEGCRFCVSEEPDSAGRRQLFLLRDRAAVDLVNRWRDWFYDPRGSKRVPNWIFDTDSEFREAFWLGCLAGDGQESISPGGRGRVRLDDKGQIAAAGLYLLADSLGYSASLLEASSEDDLLRPDSVVRKVETVGSTDGYVYDLETENHHFAAGVGRMVVHNTDSVMVSFPLKNNCNGRRAAFLLGNEGAALVTRTMGDFRSLTMEKIYLPYKLFRKKRYCGIKWLSPDDLAPSQDIKGIDVVRRDCIPIFKELILKMVDAMLSTGKYESPYEIFCKFRDDVLSRRFDVASLVQTKSVKPHYANENQIQVVVCRQMEEDVPGSAPAPGGRVAYIVGNTGRKDDSMYKRVIAWNRAEKFLANKQAPPGFVSCLDIVYYLEHNLRSIFVSIFDQWIQGGQSAAERHFDQFCKQAAIAASGQRTLRDYCGLDSSQPTPPSTTPTIPVAFGMPSSLKRVEAPSSSSSSSVSTRPAKIRSLTASAKRTPGASPSDDPAFKRRKRGPPASAANVDQNAFTSLFARSKK